MKKTLIFNGSPRRKGFTSCIVESLAGKLEGEVRTVEAYRADISPCVDCRWCFEREGCCIEDGMQQLFPYLEECDHIIMASPIYFGELSGQLLAVLSRLQTYFSARFVRGREPLPKRKSGAVILTAGSFGPREKAEDTALFLLRQMSTDSLGTIYLKDTDSADEGRMETLEEEIRRLADLLNKQ